MIPLIKCNQRDLGSYYSGCTLFTTDLKPVQSEGVNSDGTFTCITAEMQTQIIKASDLYVQYLRPFFDSRGVIHGVQVGRSYKRAPRYNHDVLSELEQFAKGELPMTFDGEFGRVSYQFFVKPAARKLKTALFYYDELVGFFAEGAFYVPDEYIRERLSKILGDKYVVHPCQI